MTSDSNFENNENFKNDNDSDNDFDSINKSANSCHIYDYNVTKALIHKNIEYTHYVKYKDNPQSIDIRLIDELVDCMLDVICTEGEKVKINSEYKDRQVVIAKYLSLNANDIQHVIAKYKEQRNKITHISSYIKTLLYTVKQERNFFYENAVRVG